MQTDVPKQCFRIGFFFFFINPLPIFKISSKLQLISWAGSVDLTVTSFTILSPAYEKCPASPEV